MILLQKKRILLVVSCIFVSLFVYFFSVNRPEDVIQTVSLPVSNKVIVIDAGHGKPDEGETLLHFKK